MIEIVTITWQPVPGSTGTLVEYRVQGTVNWTTPSSPANPTIYSSYPIIADTTLNYDIRLTTYGTACGPRSATTQLGAINTTTSTTTTTTTALTTSTTSTTSTTISTTSSTTTSTTTQAVSMLDIRLGDNTSQICSAGDTTVYYTGTFGPGTTIYYDSALTEPVLTYNLVGLVASTHAGEVVTGIYNLDSTSGKVGTETLYNCNTAPVEISDYSGQTSATTVTINGVQVAGVTFPTATGAFVNGTTDQIGTQSIFVQWVTTSTNCSLIISDSNGNHSCINFSGSGNHTFTGQIININGPILVTFHNGNTC